MRGRVNNTCNILEGSRKLTLFILRRIEDTEAGNCGRWWKATYLSRREGAKGRRNLGVVGSALLSASEGQGRQGAKKGAGNRGEAGAEVGEPRWAGGRRGLRARGAKSGAGEGQTAEKRTLLRGVGDSPGMSSSLASEIRADRKERRVELLRGITGMQHRRREASCPLCLIWGVKFNAADRRTWGRQHAHAARLWEQWDGRRDWPERVALAASDILGVEVSPEEAREHFRRHRVEQPHPPGKLDRRQALADAAMLSPVAQAILTALYRQRLLSRTQIVELFFSGHRGRSGQVMADRELQALCHRHFAYRFYPDPDWEGKSGFPGGLVNEVFYLFGRNGTPYIEDHYGARVWSDAATTMARQVGRQTFVHDWRAASVYCALDRALRERDGMVELPNGERTSAEAKRENWYGARLIGMRLWSRRLRRELDMRPDGFASISLERSGLDEGSLPSTQLPFFYEFDNESKQAHVVAEQMLNYHHLALSGEAGRRFPDLAVEGYAVPMVMVFRGRGRVEEVGRSFRRRAHREGYRQGGVPIFMVSEPTWMDDPLAEGILHLAWDETLDSLSLLDALLRSSVRLLETRALTAPQVLALDSTPSPRRQAAKDAAEREAKKKSRARQRRQDGGAPPEAAELPAGATSLTGDPLAAGAALQELFAEDAPAAAEVPPAEGTQAEAGYEGRRRRAPRGQSI